jgi:hypothetical protein
MTEIDFAEYLRLEELAAARYRAGIPPTEDDRRWFERNRRANKGWPRRYRVRDSVATDAVEFMLGLADPKEFLTIVRGGEWWLALVSRDEKTFGPIVNCDGYARLRLRLVPGVLWQNDAEWVP